MKILVLYGTTEGHTRKITEFVRDRLHRAGHVVTAVDAVSAGPDADPARFDLTIVAASLHVGRFQAAVVDFARRHHVQLAAKPAAFLAVSLAAAGDDEEDRQGLAACVAKFAHDTGWTPQRLLHVAGAFRFTQYDFFKQWAMKYIAWTRGLTVRSGEDLELTNWDSLGRFVDGVAATP